MEYGYGVSPSHQKRDKSECSERGLECCKVTRRLCKTALVISDIKVKHTSASMTGEVLAYLVSEGSYSGMLNGDFVERL